MAITNASKPTTSIANATRVVQYETWDTNATTFDAETRTWDEMGTTMSNATRVTASITNTAKPA